MIEPKPARAARLLAAALACAGACRSDQPGGDGTTGDGATTTGGTTEGSTSSSSSESSAGSSTTDDAVTSTGDPIIPIDCTEACVDTTTDAGIAVCYSCRCKAAFDNWLPTPDEVQCSTAEPIVTYHADISGAQTELVPAAQGVTSCANPSLLTGSCDQGSKIGELRHDDVMLRWICRDPYDDGSGTPVYTDMGLVGQNVRTGVTCFWDDVDNVTHDDDMPGLDLLEATDEQLAHHLEVFYFTDGGSCSECHDHDPFIYTPYLQSAPWTTVAADKGPYSLVNLDGTGRATAGYHLVSPEAAACTSCHRMGSRNTCAAFARDSLGLDKGAAYEQEVRDAALPGSAHWKLAYWMPNTGVPIPDFATWTMLFDTARDHILQCCDAPGQDIGACLWEPVPAQ